MKIAIFGANGQLGRAFSEKLNKDHELSRYDISQFDITDYVLLTNIINESKPDIIINCAAFTDTEKCESDAYSNYMINSFVPFVLADNCSRLGIKLIQFSTDYVFDGAKTALYNENDSTNPLNEYGKAKLICEKLVINRAPNSLVFRLSWVYGKGHSNFISKFVSWSRKNQFLRITNDEISVPTSVDFIANTVLKAVNLSLDGLYHLTPKNYCSRFEWALAIKSFLNINIDVFPAKMEEFPSQIIRPNFSAMSSDLLANDLKVEFPDWHSLLRDYIALNEEYFNSPSI